MAKKLTKKDRALFQNILRNMERAQDYLNQDNVAVAWRCKHATTTLHYTRADGKKILYEINKQVGSDLIGLRLAIDELGNYLATH